jgi:hypothetical protein
MSKSGWRCGWLLNHSAHGFGRLNQILDGKLGPGRQGDFSFFAKGCSVLAKTSCGVTGGSFMAT